MDRDWGRLGRAVKAARQDSGMTQDDLAKAVGVGLSTVQTLERGSRSYAKVNATHKAIAKAVGWTEDSVEAVLAGGNPTIQGRHGDVTPSVEAEGEVVDELLDELTGRVRAALLGGRVADATAIALDTPDEGDVVIIWKEGETRDLTPEERRKLQKKWSRLQRAAHEIFSEDTE
ncbi:helix-turn-helix transcriptional regulator [Kitasatospora sp. NPDC018058]|uniref:helix-turn-helix transcriptional regulator n=1 Tax=Kitasatospora sp. NPDC018058 TaxID=3364025 RepID=UPI0037BE8B54